MADMPPPRHRPGRPRTISPDPSAPVSTRVSLKHYDALYAIARARRETVGAVVRGFITHSLTSSSTR